MAGSWMSDEQLEAVKSAYASAVLTVETRYGRVTYQNLGDMAKAIEREERGRAQAANGGRSSSSSFVSFGGFGRSRWTR